MIMQPQRYINSKKYIKKIHQPQTPSPISSALLDSPAGVSERSPVQTRTWWNCSTRRGLRCCTHPAPLPHDRPPPGDLFSVLWVRWLLSLSMESRLGPELVSEVRLYLPAQRFHTVVWLVLLRWVAASVVCPWRPLRCSSLVTRKVLPLRKTGCWHRLK